MAQASDITSGQAVTVTELTEDAARNIAEAAGWGFDEPANEFRLNDNGDGYDAIADASSWRELVAIQKLV